MPQMRLGTSDKVLKLNVSDRGVDCLNKHDFTDAEVGTGRLVHIGGKVKNAVTWEPLSIEQAIEAFKNYYNCDKVEISHLSHDEVMRLEFPDWKVKK